MKTIKEEGKMKKRTKIRNLKKEEEDKEETNE